ncbi:MAG: adenylyltransferase/cytidyltransferase family protein [Planctomycetales bacterium]|nr:adenylyltransferase/cytidyltransferase family protein [Planctomycetales bacterium]
MTGTVIITCGCFDNLSSRQIRFLQEASRAGELHLLLFDDALTESLYGAAPKFPLAERQYCLGAVRYVEQVHVISDVSELENVSNLVGGSVEGWYLQASENIPECSVYADKQHISCCRIKNEQLMGFPENTPPGPSLAKKAIVTGCFDWFHSGHVRFLEEASQYGDVYVVVGHDKNIELLKGVGHPMFSQAERRYMAGAIRFVRQALVSTGHGWLDAEPEIRRIRPDFYVVNEDGDQPAKREFCRRNGIEYVVLKRRPKPGLQRRTSTHLRGF